MGIVLLDLLCNPAKSRDGLLFVFDVSHESFAYFVSNQVFILTPFFLLCLRNFDFGS